MKFTTEQCAQVFNDITEGKTGKPLEKTIKDFISSLEEVCTLSRIQEIVRTIASEWETHHRAAHILVETAYPLSKDLRTEIEKFAPGANITERVSKELIGGMKIRLDDRLIDGSVAGSLERLRQVLSE